MASNNTNQTANATAKDFGGDEFANNLFSDLAPLLTLFGEQVTKQFLSLSMGWADNFLLAMAPLGIITVVVSSVRVTKNRLLKAIVGRARESRATAEMELLSSTSDEVCELFDGNQIVRVLGEPKTQEFVYLERTKNQSPMVWDLKEALAERKLKIDVSRREYYHIPYWVSNGSSILRERITGRKAKSKARAKVERDRIELVTKRDLEAKTQRVLDNLLTSAPNIILNVPEAVASRWELWAFAFIGILLQLAVLVFGALTTYHWKFMKGGAPIAAYGYPCTIAGTLAVSTGLLLCSHVIEGSTDECKLQKETDDQLRILRIQRACSASEQHFGSYALFNSQNSQFLLTSRLNNRNFTVTAAVGCFISITGFIVQFVGLRALHWSATIMQLGATVFMTCIRSYVRRGLAHDMEWDSIPEGEELAWLTEFICHNEGLELLTGAYVPYENIREGLNTRQERFQARGNKRVTLTPLDYTLPRKPGSSKRIQEDSPTPLRALLNVGFTKIYASPGDLPEDWEEDFNLDGTMFYVNDKTGMTTSVRPKTPETYTTLSKLGLNTFPMEMINQRSRVARMTSWGEPQNELSQKLIAAMLQVRELLENPQNTDFNGISGYETAWEMNTVSHPEDFTVEGGMPPRPLLRSITFRLSYKKYSGEDKDPFENLRNDIGTVLSLWLRTIQKRSSAPGWNLDSPAALKQNRARIEDMPPQALRSYFLRIIAKLSSGDDGELTNLERLGEWLDAPVIRVVTPDGTISFSASKGFDGKGYDSHEDSRFLLHQHPIFGLRFSTLIIDNKEHQKDQADLGNLAFTHGELEALKDLYQENIPPWCKRNELVNPSSSILDQGNFGKHITPAHREVLNPIKAGKVLDEAINLRRILQPELAVYSQGTLAQNCAMEIFSDFLYAATEQVKTILGTTVFQPGKLEFDRGLRLEYEPEPRFDIRDAPWTNTVIDAMVSVLFDLGLVETLSDGKNVIIPVLFARGLLPTRESIARKPKEKTLDDWLVRV